MGFEMKNQFQYVPLQKNFLYTAHLHRQIWRLSQVQILLVNVKVADLITEG